MLNEALAPAKALVDTFVDEATDARIADLQGTYVMVEHNRDTISQVVGTSGRELQWQQRFDLWTPNKITPNHGTFTYQGEMRFIGKESEILRSMDGSDPRNVEFTQVFGYSPRILIKEWGAYSADDYALDKILDMGLALFPNIGSRDDVAALTKWVRREFPYKRANTVDCRHFENLGSRLGKEIVCAQLSLIELAMLRLRRAKTTPIEFGVGDESHAALIVDLSPESRLYVDPTTGDCEDLGFACTHLVLPMGAKSDPVKGFSYSEKEFVLV